MSSSLKNAPVSKRTSRKIKTIIPPDKSISITDTIIIALITVVAYLVTFFYEWGYFSYFEIPLEFVSFDLSRVFIAMLVIITIFASIYFNADYFYSTLNELSEPLKWRLILLWPVLIFMFIWAISFGSFPKLLIYGFIGFVAGIAMLFITPLITEKDKKGYLAKLKSADKKDNFRKKNEKPGFVIRLIDFLGPRVFLVIVTFLFGLFIAYGMGYKYASSQTQFYVVNTSPERAVLWNLNDHMICAPFNRLSKEIAPSFIVLNIGSNPNLEYHYENIGPLKLRDFLIANPINSP